MYIIFTFWIRFFFYVKAIIKKVIFFIIICFHNLTIKKFFCISYSSNGFIIESFHIKYFFIISFRYNMRAITFFILIKTFIFIMNLAVLIFYFHNTIITIIYYFIFYFLPNIIYFIISIKIIIWNIITFFHTLSNNFNYWRFLDEWVLILWALGT